MRSGDPRLRHDGPDMLGGLSPAPRPQQPVLATALRALSLPDLVHQLQGIEEGIWHGNGPVAQLTALLQRSESNRLCGEVHPISGELQGLGDPAPRVGHHHAKGTHFAPVVLGGRHQEALALFPGQIFAFPIDSEQFIRNLFTLTYQVAQEKGLNPVISGGGQGRR